MYSSCHRRFNPSKGINGQLEEVTIHTFLNILLTTIISIGGTRQRNKNKRSKDTMEVVDNFHGVTLNHLSTKIYNEKIDCVNQRDQEKPPLALDRTGLTLTIFSWFQLYESGLHLVIQS
jgi:hypothetical protein